MQVYRGIQLTVNLSKYRLSSQAISHLLNIQSRYRRTQSRASARTGRLYTQSMPALQDIAVGQRLHFLH